MAKDKQEDLPADLEELARRYVDLWQDQMTARAADPEFAENLQKVMAAMGVAASGLPAMWSAWPAAMSSLMAAAQPGMKNPRGQETHDEPAGDGPTGEGPTGEGPTGERPAGAQRDGGGGRNAASAGAAAAAPASDGGGPDLGLLEERLAALEQRLHSLEERSRRPRRGTKAKSERG